MTGASSRPYKAPGIRSKAGRLKAVNLDPLEVLGLPSKGDNRLLNFEVQEQYYDKIVDRYDHLRDKPSDSRYFSEAFAYLSLDGTSEDRPPATADRTRGKGPDEGFHSLRQDHRELATILMAMRKLREAIVASARRDDFALKAYIFMARATILEKHMESYHPALLHLLHNIHPANALSDHEYQEFVGYLVLDLACRQNDLAAAYRVKYYHCNNPKIEAVLKALVRGDWCSFWKIENAADTYQKQLMSWKEEEVRKHAANCVGKSYLSLDKSDLERALNNRWEEFAAKDDLGWLLEENVVTIKRIKG